MTPQIAAVPSLYPALPEIVLAIVALAVVLLGAIRGEGARKLIESLVLMALVAAFIMILGQGSEKLTTFNGAFISDGFARFMKCLTLAGSAAGILLSSAFMRDEKIARFEYSILILLATIGMMVMISSNELISLYLGVELQSLSLYVLASIHRDNLKATESGLKYFVLGALSSGMLLYGASLIYGFTGSVTFPVIAKAVSGPQGAGVIFGLVFLLAGMAFKISAVPFHMWTPDVYEGAPTPVTAFFAGAPKMAAMAMLTRVMIDAFPAITNQWQPMIAFLALASMVWGAFAAIGQSNLKRLMAYSSIGNMGYALVGLAAGTVTGVEGIAIFLTIYLAMTLGVFGCILAMRHAGGRFETIEDLSGLAKNQPLLAFIFAALMFSLIGIPPLAGFFGKFYVFSAAVEAKLWVLAIVGIVASVVSAFYYLRIIKVMYFDEARVAFLPAPMEVRFITYICAILVFAFAIFPAGLKTAATAAAKSLF